MYGYPSYDETPSTPRSSRRSTLLAQTPTQSRATSTLVPSTLGTARSTMTVTAAGSGDAVNGDPTLITYTTISQEYASLRYPGHCPLGMYLIPDKNSTFVWDGVFFVHQGLSIIHPPSLERADVPSSFILPTTSRCLCTPTVIAAHRQSILRPHNRP